MKKAIVITQFIISLLALIYFRFITTNVNIMTNWGLYFFVVPLIFFAAMLYTKNDSLLKLLIGTFIAGAIIIMLYRGSWTEGLILLKLSAYIAGAVFSAIEYRLIK